MITKKDIYSDFIENYRNKPTGDIYKSDVEKIKTLYAEPIDISDISEIKNLTNLETVHLSNNSISNFDVI